jgi:hypothetical protein
VPWSHAAGFRRSTVAPVGVHCLASSAASCALRYLAEEFQQVRMLANRFLDSVPVPTGGDLLVEINLIGWGLVGGTAEGLNALLAYQEVAAAAGVPERAALVHVTYERNGVKVGEAWHESGTDGPGHAPGELGSRDRASAYEVKVDVGRQPASDRLRRLLAALRPEVDPARLPMAYNALAVADRVLTPSAADPELLAAQRLILAQMLAIPTGGGPAVVPLLSASRAIFDHMKRGRHLWAMDARAAATLLLAAHVPAACARARWGNPTSAAREYRRLLALAADRLHAGRWEMTGELVVSAVRDGYLEALDSLGAYLNAEAVALRDSALGGPPDPLEFAGRLYDAAPFAFAAGWLCRSAREHATDPARARDLAQREAAADDLFLRLCDGLHSQLSDWALGGLWAERAMITAARARGDSEGAWRLLSAGELALRWPRSYRPFLLGEGPAPAVRVGG